MSIFYTADHFFMKKLRIVMKMILHPPTDIDYFSVGMVKDINDLTDIFRQRFKQDITDLQFHGFTR